MHVDRTCVFYGGGGSVTVHRRWGDVWIGARIGQRWKEKSPWVFLKLGDRTTVKDRRWGELGVTEVGRTRRLLCSGGSAFASWRNRRSVRRWSAFGMLVDRRLVRWSAFGSLCDRRWSFFLWLALSFVRWVLSLSLSFRKWFEVKMRGVNDFRVKGENSGQLEVIFRKMIFSVTAKHSGFTENDFRKQFSPNLNTP